MQFSLSNAWSRQLFVALCRRTGAGRIEGQRVRGWPGGQSGHFLSPFYRNGHRAWADGEATPFLPGPTAHTLTLVPAG